MGSSLDGRIVAADPAPGGGAHRTGQGALLSESDIRRRSTRPGPDLQEALVRHREWIRRRLVRDPRGEMRVATAAVVHAAGVEAPQAGGDVQPLQRPVAVDDSEVGRLGAPRLVPGHAILGRRTRRPAPVPADAATREEAVEDLEGLRGLVAGEEAFPVASAGEARLDLTRSPIERGETPARRHRAMDHGEATLPQRVVEAHRQAAQPIDPVRQVGSGEHVPGGVEGAGLAEAEGGLEQAHLMVAEHDPRPTGFPEPADGAQHVQIARPPIDQVAHQPQLEIRAEVATNPLDQGLQLVATALNVAYEDPLHGPPAAPRSPRNRNPRGAKAGRSDSRSRYTGTSSAPAHSRGCCAAPPSPAKFIRESNGSRRLTSLARRIIVCDGLASARLWRRIGAGDDEELFWVPGRASRASAPPASTSCRAG